MLLLRRLELQHQEQEEEEQEQQQEEDRLVSRGPAVVAEVVVDAPSLAAVVQKHAQPQQGVQQHVQPQVAHQAAC